MQGRFAVQMRLPRSSKSQARHAIWKLKLSSPSLDCQRLPAVDLQGKQHDWICMTDRLVLSRNQYVVFKLQRLLNLFMLQSITPSFIQV